MKIELFFCFLVLDFVAYPDLSQCTYTKLLRKFFAGSFCDPHITLMTRNAATFEFL